jgi:hypothetical protein
VGKNEGRKPIKRHRGSREDNINMDLHKVGYGDIDWMEVGQDRDKKKGTCE